MASGLEVKGLIGQGAFGKIYLLENPAGYKVCIISDLKRHIFSLYEKGGIHNHLQ